MSRVVYKYPIFMDNWRRLQCVKPVLFAEDPSGNLSIWVEHDDEKPEPTWLFKAYGTGNGIEDDAGDHLFSTVVGPFVWHLYGKKD